MAKAKVFQKTPTGMERKIFFSSVSWRSCGPYPRGHVLTYGQVAALADTPRAARQVGRILYASGRTVPWQRVINSYGGLSTYKVGSGELQRALLEKEGITFRLDGTLDLKKYQWQPNIRTIKKLNLPEEIAFQINARLPFSKDNPKIKKTRPGMGRNGDRKTNYPLRPIPS